MVLHYLARKDAKYGRPAAAQKVVGSSRGGRRAWIQPSHQRQAWSGIDEPLDEPPRLLEEGRVRRGLPPERVRAPAIGETVLVRRAAPPEAAPAEEGASPLEL
jgi:hypothetical protein